jgi:hypothetical protein
MMSWRSGLAATRAKWLFVGGGVIAPVLLLQWQQHQIRKVHNEGRARNRVHLPVRWEQEFEPLTALPVPLLANFSYSNDQVSAALSKELVEIVQYDTDSSISLVNVEADEPGVQELLQRYRIMQIPTVIALRGGNPVSRYTVPGNTVEGINREQLKAWIEDAAPRRQ